MQRLLWTGALLLLLLAGCGIASGKRLERRLRVEIYAAGGGELLAAVEDSGQAAELVELPDALTGSTNGLTPAYELRVYQERKREREKAPPEGEAEEEGFELIETITTFHDSPCVAASFSEDLVSSPVLPREALDFDYTMPERAVARLAAALDE